MFRDAFLKALGPTFLMIGVLFASLMPLYLVGQSLTVKTRPPLPERLYR